MHLLMGVLELWSSILKLFFFFILLFNGGKEVSGLGTMSSIAVSYGADGPVVCGLLSDGSHLVSCYGSDASIVYGAPLQTQFAGLAAGDGFACGLLEVSGQPYCWGSNPYVPMGVPQPMLESATYSLLSAGDHHLCALRRPISGDRAVSVSLVDCWGYNMTASKEFYGGGGVVGLTAGSAFNCALLGGNRTAACWGDDTGSGVVAAALPPSGETRFRAIAAGGFHVCGIREKDSTVECWGRSADVAAAAAPPVGPIASVVGGRFHACGIQSVDREVVCWGFAVSQSVPPPRRARMLELAAGDYFTCGVSDELGGLQPICWGSSGPWSMPLAVSPGICAAGPCGLGYYDYSRSAVAGGSVGKLCRTATSRVCLPCSAGCPPGSSETSPCNETSDRTCTPGESERKKTIPKLNGLFATQLPIFTAELIFAVVLIASVSSVACLFVRHRLRNCKCSGGIPAASTPICGGGCKDSIKIRPELRRARAFSYSELEKATDGFNETYQVGRGSFSCVFKGVLSDGTTVAVKRAMRVSFSKEFKTELDLLSRLNHAHLLNLLGYCEEGGERLLVYEFMANGSLHHHLHGGDPTLKKKMTWIRRATVAVQAARGIEYLHGYACPPVIHRDIKSSNILIDEEGNARVADFGLSLLGPADSGSPLSELPAGTLGYLDPEYYRLHYLTTKSDVYSFGVLLLEILSGRKAIDLGCEEGNIVEWAVPLIKSGDVGAVLDPVLGPTEEVGAVAAIASVACKCVRMRGKDRPAMEKVTTALERALATLVAAPGGGHGGCEPILPTEVVLGSSRMHGKGGSSASNRSEMEVAAAATSGRDGEEQRFEFRAPSWITFPSVTSSLRRASMSDGGDVTTTAAVAGGGDGLRRLEEEIGPASPQKELYLQNNF